MIRSKSRSTYLIHLKKWIIAILTLCLLLISYILWERTGTTEDQQQGVLLNKSIIIDTQKSTQLHVPQEKLQVDIVQDNAIQEKRTRATSPLKDGILKDMERCSLSMGVSKERLASDKVEINRIAAEASYFLQALREVLPEENRLNHLKNPCWLLNMTIPQDIVKVIRADIRHQYNKLQADQIATFADTLFESTSLPPSKSQQSLYCLPYFFLAGFPKCGTSTLSNVFNNHHQITGPETKEPQWWTRTPLKKLDKNYLKITIVRYLLYFQSASKYIRQHPRDGMITYDASQSCMTDSNFKKGIHGIDYCAQIAVTSRILPNLKFIVAMREPVSRLYSAFYYYNKKRFAKLSIQKQEDLPSVFHVGASNVVQRFQDCLSQYKSVYECRGEVNAFAWSKIRANISDGIYYDELRNWMMFYPGENFLVIRTSDMTSDPVGVMKNITDFLGLDQVSKGDAHKWFSDKKHSRNKNFTSSKYEMMPETKHLLQDFYSPYNKKLVDLLNDSRFSWNY